MRIPETSVLKINKTYLICSLYTLCGNHKVFRKFNLKNDTYINIKNFNCLSYNVKKFYGFSALINKSSLKELSFGLLKPFLTSSDILTDLNFDIKKALPTFYDETILLRKYLLKFNHNYRKYFFYQNGNFVNLPTNKEINMYAIESLFLLAGI